MLHKIHTMLAIGGSDPCGGAGIQADIVSARSLGIHTMSAITAVTSQNSHGVFNSGEVAPKLLKQQLEAISQECDVDGIKIGLLISIPQIEIVVNFINSLLHPIPIVVDPVLKATSAINNFTSESDQNEFLAALSNFLFPLATTITPNIDETFVIFSELRKISKLNLPLNEIGKYLLDWWNCQSIIIKGGHSNTKEISDRLFVKTVNGIKFKSFSHTKLDCRNLHGTGCVFSSLLTCYMILGQSVEDAFQATSEKMEKIIKRSIDYELKGNCTNGPLNIIDYKLI